MGFPALQIARCAEMCTLSAPQESLFMANITADASVLTLQYLTEDAILQKLAPAGGRSCGAEAGTGGQIARGGDHAGDGGVGLGVVRPVVVPEER